MRDSDYPPVLSRLAVDFEFLVADSTSVTLRPEIIVQIGIKYINIYLN